MSTPKTIILITGANQGIGLSTASIFAENPNNHVFIGSRDAAKGTAAAKSLSHLPGTVEGIQLDITSAASVAAAAKHLSGNVSHVDILINNAGISTDHLSASGQCTFAEALRGALETNVIGAAAVTDALQPLLLKSSNPRILFLSSGLGSLSLVGDPEWPFYSTPGYSYSVSKAALNMLMITMTKKLAAGMGGSGKKPKCWAVDPGYVSTNLNAYQGTGTPEETAKFIAGVAGGERDEEVGRFVHANGTHPW